MNKSIIILPFIIIGLLQITASAQNREQIKSKGFDFYIGYNPFFHDANMLHGIEVKLQRRSGKWKYGLEANRYLNELQDGLDNYTKLTPNNWYMQGLVLKDFKQYGFSFGRNLNQIYNIEFDANLMLGFIEFSADFYEFEYVDTLPNGDPVYLLQLHLFPRELSWLVKPSISASYGINRFSDIEFILGYNLISDEMDGKSAIRGLVNALGIRIKL